MSELELTRITVSTSRYLRARVDSVCNFSESCESTSVHPAQGLRVGKRHTLVQPAATATVPSQQDVLAASTAVLQIVQPGRKCTVVTRNHVAPEHFLLRTILDTFTTVQSALPVIPDIHFVRTQRHYNKRRYARVRAVSRPSF